MSRYCNTCTTKMECSMKEACQNPQPAMSTIPTPRTDENELQSSRYDGEEIPGFDYVSADFARQLERELHEAREEAAMWRHHIATCLAYPRGSEAQVRCLEEVGQDASHYGKKALAAPTQTHEPAKA